MLSDFCADEKVTPLVVILALFIHYMCPEHQSHAASVRDPGDTGGRRGDPGLCGTDILVKGGKGKPWSCKQRINKKMKPVM